MNRHEAIQRGEVVETSPPETDARIPWNRPCGMEEEPAKYAYGTLLGQGAFGVVRQAWDVLRPNAMCVAIKQIKRQREGTGIPQDVYREIKILKEIKWFPTDERKHIVQLERVFQSRDGKGMALNLVYQYAEHDLSEIIRFHRSNNLPIDMRMVKSILKQLLEGLAFLHRNWIMHRDLKPANILIMDEPTCHPADTGCVQIGDFGLARLFREPVRSLHLDGVVQTIWYRAPELLLGSKHYTQSVDMWSVGCIFAELLTRQPLFPGKAVDRKNCVERDQLERIFVVLDRPTATEWPLVEECTFYDEMQSWDSSKYANKLKNVVRLEGASTEYDLISKMLDFDPTRRISAEEALKHPFFRERPLAHEKNAFLHANGRRHKYPTQNYKKAALASSQKRKSSSITDADVRVKRQK